jgi:hypothetical protein
MQMRNAIKMVGLALTLALSACGGDNGEDLGRFVGTWQPTSGTLNLVCQGQLYTDSVTSNLTWRTGVSSDLVQTADGSPCAITADVNGATATGVPGQACAAPGGQQTTTFAAYTFVVSPDGRTAAENTSGSITFFSQGASVACTFNETASYQKIGN